MNLIKGFLMSLTMFSVIPAPQLWEDRAFPLVIPSLPLVGALIGGLSFGFASLLVFLGAPLLLAAALILLCPLFVSGFIHIDGLMDTCDAIFSRGDLQKKRSILKDSHVGAFAVIGLSVYLLLAFSSVFTALEVEKSLLPLLFIPVLSRSVSGFAMLSIPSFSPQGFAASFQKNTRPVHRVALAITALLALSLAFIFGGPFLLIPLGAVVLGGILLTLFVKKELKGISGDLCGFIITASELCGLLLWALF